MKDLRKYFPETAAASHAQAKAIVAGMSKAQPALPCYCGDGQGQRGKYMKRSLGRRGGFGAAQEASSDQVGQTGSTGGVTIHL